MTTETTSDTTKAITDETGVETYSDFATLNKYAEDASVFHIMPLAVTYPKDVADLSKLVTFANAHPGISLAARSAGTCMSGGSLTQSVMVDFLKHFNHVRKVGDGYAVTEPGVFYRDFEKETLKKGLLLPCYTASRELNTVGGMVGNNSAGEKTLTYGQTERYVKKLKVVLRDGNEYTFEKLTRSALEAKKSQQDLEGEIYRGMDELIRTNIDIIEAAKPRVSKNSTGYLLWNVYDKQTDTFDLTKLIVGSQGTLGFVTEITFDLIKPKEHSRLVVAFLPPELV
jgi:FAD/FMN-containing dehydrogenase